MFLEQLSQGEGIGLLTEIYTDGLICLFVFFFGWYLVRMLWRWIQLKMSARFVSKQIKKIGDFKETRKQIQSSILAKVTWAKGQYQDFRVTWEESRVRGEDRASTPVRLAEFLTPDVVIEGVVNRRIAEALPGIFVALGILGTFLGLVLGLMGLQIQGEIANLEGSVEQLISGLSLAFRTSLLGIILSVVFSFSYRLLSHRLEAVILRLDELVYQLFPCHSSESYARKYFEIQGDIKQSMQTMATDVATSLTGALAPAMDEALSRNLLPVMEELKDQIKRSVDESKQQQLKILGDFGQQVDKMSSVITDHFENSQEKQSAAMEGVLKQYVEKMNQAFSVQFQDMGRIIEETTRVQSQIREEMVRFTEKLQQQFEVQSGLIDKTTRAGEILGESLESLEGISRELKSSADDIATAAKLLEESAAKAMEGHGALRESMDRQIETMTTTSTELEKGWATITENTESVVEVTRQVIRELGEGIGEQLTKALGAFDGKVGEVVERFSGTLFEVNEVVGELPALLGKLDETFEAVRAEVTEQKGVLHELSAATKDIVAPNIEKAAVASQELQQTAESIVQSRESLETWYRDVLDKLAASSSAFENRVNALVGQVRQGTDELFLKANESLKLFAEDGPIHTALVVLNNNVARELHEPEEQRTGLAEVLANLNSNLEALKERIQELCGGDGQIGEQISKGLASIATQANALSEALKNDCMQTLRRIDQSASRMAGSFDELRASADAGETKRGFFRRIISK